MKKASKSELIVMEALWNSKKPLSRGELTEVLNGKPYFKKWQIGTVSTFARRLSAKNLVKCGKEGKLIRYITTVDKLTYFQTTVDQDIKTTFGKDKDIVAVVLQYCSAEDDEKNRERVTRLISSLSKKAK